MTVTGYLGLDLGGTGAKAGVFDSSGKMLGFERCGYAPEVFPDGRVEIPIEDIYDGARKAALGAIQGSGAKIRAMAVASQGQTFVTLDAGDRPLHNAIIWYDSRASEQAERLKARIAASGVGSMPLLEAIAVAPKVMWLREHSPDAMSRASRYLLLPDYVSYRLTGQAVTDPATAASTGLYAEDGTDYAPEALEAAGISAAELARIQMPGSPIAQVDPDTASDWGLDGDALVVTGTNDQYAGAMGAGNVRPGIVSETTGTCLALVTLTEQLPDTMPPGLIGGRFPIAKYQFALAYLKTAGILLDWFKQQFCPCVSFDELTELAAQVPIGSRGITVLPHFDGMVSPTPNAAARGAICGLTLSHTLGDIHRAVLESLAFGLRENLEMMRRTGFDIDSVRAIGGGAKNDLWLQIKADITGTSVERPAVAEAAVLGAAALAAAGAGDFGSAEEAAVAFYRTGQVFEPNRASHAAYEQPYQVYLDLCRRLYE